MRRQEAERARLRAVTIIMMGSPHKAGLVMKFDTTRPSFGCAGQNAL